MSSKVKQEERVFSVVLPICITISNKNENIVKPNCFYDFYAFFKQGVAKVTLFF